MIAHVCVHGLSEARAALTVAESLGRPIALLSGPGAAGYAGCGWWLALMAQAKVGYAPCPDFLDCADAAGYAMAALRAGQKGIILYAETPALSAVAAIASDLQATLLTQRPDCFDMAGHGAEYRLGRWLIEI